MKAIPENLGSPSWDNSLIADLSYIKKNLRYRIKLKTLMPVIVWTSLIVIMCILFLFLYIEQRKAGENPKSGSFIFGVSAVIPILTIVARYLYSLRFISLQTPFFIDGNMATLERFLKSQHLLTFRHPDAPEVYQILSRNISAGKEDREVVIFIADDKRILINSHFTSAGWGFTPHGHHRQMANMLKEFIQQQQSTGQSLSRQTF